MNLREKILNAQDISREIVHVDLWDVGVEVRGLTAAQRAEVVEASRGEDGVIQEHRMPVPIVIASCYNPETKEQLFAVADREALEGKAAAAVEQLATAALRLSGMSPGAQEQIRKNSGGTPSDASTSA